MHERDAPELVPDPGLQAIFDQGTRVGELACERLPGGILVPNDDRRVEATREAIANGARTLYEASFVADDVFVAVDILVRADAGWRLIEVKSTTCVKDVHIADAAIQTRVLERAGLRVHAVEIMHLNRKCRYPDLSDLFVRADVTARVRALLPHDPGAHRRAARRAAQTVALVDTGPHCRTPYECPFQSRCLAPLPEHHVSTLYRGGRHAAEFLAEGVQRIEDIVMPLDGIQERQRRAVQSGQPVVDVGLADALAPFVSPIAFLDFETVSLAIPCWSGCSPYDTVPVQFSVHAEHAGGMVHHAWLADGPEDPRRALALAVLDACAGTKTVVAYNASFERGVIMGLATACPDLAAPLAAVADRLVDLLPVVREHVYHPDFGGGFGLKGVLLALAGQGYSDLAFADGGARPPVWGRLVFEPMAARSATRSVATSSPTASATRGAWSCSSAGCASLRRGRRNRVRTLPSQPMRTLRGEVHDGDAVPTDARVLSWADCRRPHSVQRALGS